MGNPPHRRAAPKTVRGRWRHEQARRGADGRLVRRSARSRWSAAPRSRRRCGDAGYDGAPIDVTRDAARLARPARRRARTSSSTRCTAAAARTARIQGAARHPGHPLHPFRRCWPRRSPWTSRRPSCVFDARRHSGGRSTSSSTARRWPAGDPMPRPYVIKPLNEGSSVGVRIVRDGDDLAPLGRRLDLRRRPVMVERFIPGRELTVAVMGDRPLAVTEITTDRGFYDYDAKYAPGGSRHVVPAQVRARRLRRGDGARRPRASGARLPRRLPRRSPLRRPSGSTCSRSTPSRA